MSSECNEMKKYSNKLNYQIALQSLFIGLLNQFASISLKKRNVKTSVTLPFLCITQLSFSPNDTVFLWELIEEKINKMYQYDIQNGVKQNTAQSRVKRNRIIQSIQILEDMLFQFGYRFGYKFIYKKNGNVSLELVHEIYFNKVLQFSTENIKEKGSQINEYLRNAMNQRQYIEIDQNNDVLQSLLYGK